MGVELRPFGVRCNIQCQYCYQDPTRQAASRVPDYDMASMKAALREEGQPFSLFGGEPLLLPIGDLEELWAFGLEQFGKNSVQTNGTLIGDDHYRLFAKYRVHVGLSVDGPEELNDVRWAGTLESTRAATRRSLDALAELCSRKMTPSVIVTLSRCNATRDRLPRLLEWLVDLDERGVRSVRLHLLETESADIATRYSLTDEENITALAACRQLQRHLRNVRFDIFTDLDRLLRGQDGSVTCTFAGCDPYTTRAVRGIEGQGQRSNCGRTNKDGVEFEKADYAGYERYMALYATPLEHGGCQDCRFFLFCKGQCPGTAIDGDWRNRTVHCAVWFALFEAAEAELEARGARSLSKSRRLPLLERQMISHWVRGRNPQIAMVVEECRTHAG